MICDPEIETFFAHVQREMSARFAATGGLSVEERRQRAEDYATLTAEPDPAELRSRQLYIGLPGREIPVLVHRPESTAPLPTILFFHGGSFVAGSPQSHHFISASIAHNTGAQVISVHYRRAPENPYPAPLEDCYAALLWAVAQAGPLGIDTTRMAVAGDSAGGNLAAACTLLVRDRGGPALRHQALIYPGLGGGSGTPSFQTHHDDLFLKPAGILFSQKAYLGEAMTAPDDYAAPLAASSLAGVPPAYILAAELDPLHDDGRLYAEKLQAHGVAATMRTAPGMVHGFVRARRWSQVAEREFQVLCAAIREALELPVPRTRRW
ncbi:alpha/beta hydrolase [Humitalea sp. 24SJ18S-53]|uniref:alpha/beta hydrolase n=1 Tax=Humitalea sp. 24SJ18S-53 TaxID=3422307 RepID=UPI003D6659EF